MADAFDLAIRAAAYPVCWTILINGLDDLFIDVNYFARGLFRHDRRRITVADLKSVEQKRIAMLVPAWQEADVIRHMLELNLKALDYDLDKYHIFCGTYRNDKDTQREVDSVARRVRNVHKVVTPHDGPTCKADCLNWIYQAIQLLEEKMGWRFDILLMHDAEDIIHPLELRLHNFMIPEYDFVQTPVFPLDMPWNAFVACTYKDEFTEHHLKDMLVRESVGGLVPSAGVGSGFSRDTFEEIAMANSQMAFNTASLTEDYEIGMKFRLANRRVYFACRAIERTREVERGFFKKRKVRIKVDEYIATREYFPNVVGTAIRQKSRWVLGIVLQGWDQIGWQGPIPVLYCLWRDRKALLTHLMSVVAYVVAIYALVRLFLGNMQGMPWTFDNLFPPGSVLWWLVMANTLILAWRSVMKFLAVDKIYGPLHGLLSIPRFFLSNIINFAATARAVKQFIQLKITGEPLRWLKTAHAFPSAEALRQYQRRLGELLLDRQGLTEEDLDGALKLQDKTGLKLGEVLTLTGLVTARELAAALGEQLELIVEDLDAFAIPLSLLQRLPEGDAAVLNVLPIALEDADTIRVAVSEPHDNARRAKLESLLHARVIYVFAEAEALKRARERAYRRLFASSEGWSTENLPSQAPQAVVAMAAHARPRIGDYLLAHGHISPEQLAAAVDEQARSGEMMGELLVRRGLATPEAIGEALAARRWGGFRPIEPAEVDPASIKKISYGLCALYCIAPIKPARPGLPVPVAAASPMHPELRLLVEARLQSPCIPFMAPSLDIRRGLAIASHEAWPDGIVEGASGMDGAELLAIVNDPGWEGDTAELARAARLASKSPIEYLLGVDEVSADMAARLRARALGVPLASPAALDELGGHEWLPPGWALRDDLQLLDVRPGNILIAAPRPTPRLACEIATLFPDTAIAWRVAPFHRTLESTREISVLSPEAASPAAPV